MDEERVASVENGEQNIAIELVIVRTLEFLFREHPITPGKSINLLNNSAFAYFAPDHGDYIEVTFLVEVFNADAPEGHQRVMRLKTVTVFQIEGLRENARRENGDTHIPVALLTRLCEIAYDTSRGILLTKLAGTNFHFFHLPMVERGFIRPDLTEDGIDIAVLRHRDAAVPVEEFMQAQENAAPEN